MSEFGVRAMEAEDAVAARALVQRQFAGTRYCDRIVEQLERALTFDDPGSAALVAVSSRDERMSGFALAGIVGGALDVVQVRVLVGQVAGAQRSLLDAVRTGGAPRSGRRMFVSELPDDEPYLEMASALTLAGYAEEGRVADLFSDGVALRILTRRR
jgi:hypothetical protein